MTDIHKDAPEAQTGARKSYVAPKLDVFGEISALTASGSVNKNENNGHPNGMN